MSRTNDELQEDIEILANDFQDVKERVEFLEKRVDMVDKIIENQIGRAHV